MNRRNVVAMAVALVGATVIAVPSCSSSSSSPGAHSAGGGTGGGAGRGGTGEAGGSASTGAGAGLGGASGAGGADVGGAAGKATYEAPVWAPINGAPAECGMEQIVNVAKVGPAFSWIPCAESGGTAGCQETYFATPFTLAQNWGITAAEVFDDGATLAVVAIYSLDIDDLGKTRTLVARMDGTLLFAMRGTADVTLCSVGTPSLGAGRFSSTVDVTLPNAPLVAYAFLAPLEPQPEFAVANIGSIGAGAFGPSGRSAFSNGRVSFNWGGVRVHTAKWEDGSDDVLISPPGNTFLETDARAAPDGFLFEIFSGPNDLWFSDGLQPATLLLKDPTATVSMSQVVGPNLYWFRGYDPLPDDGVTRLYGHIELWMSPYSSDPSKLQPSMIRSTTYDRFHDSGSGFGWIATDGYTGTDTRTVHAWHVPDGEHRTALMGSTVGLADFGGVYRDGMVFAVWHPSKGKAVAGHTVYRIPFASMNVVP